MRHRGSSCILNTSMKTPSLPPQARVPHRPLRPSTVLPSLINISPTAAPPSSVAEASARLSSINNAEPTSVSYSDFAVDLVEASLTTQNFNDALNFAQNLNGPNSDHNVNPKNPKPPAYPRAGKTDAPYDVSEQQLRGAIYIPSTFQYGAGYAPSPCILVPGR